MAASGVGGGASPRPKSPPDLYGKRRQLAEVQLLEREITFLEEELKTLDRVQPTSRCCKEYVFLFVCVCSVHSSRVDEFVASRPDPLISLNQNRHKSGCCSCSCSLKKWGKSCFKSSWICCCFNGKSCSLGTSNCYTCSCFTCNCCCFSQSEDNHHRDQQRHQPPQHRHHGRSDGNANGVENAGCCLCDCIEQICCQPCCCFPVLSGSTTHDCCCNFKLSCLKSCFCCGKGKCKPKCCSGSCTCSSSCCC